MYELTDAGREQAASTEAPWNAVAGEGEDALVELLGGDAGPHVLGQHVERGGGELAGLAHAGKGFRSVAPDLPIPVGCATDFHVRHSADPEGPQRAGLEM